MAIFTEGTSRVSLPDSWVGVADQKYVDDQVRTEATTRSEADTTLQGNIDAEAGTRSQADTALQGKITAAEEAIQGVDNKFNNYTPTLNIPDIKVKAAGTADKVIDGATNVSGKELALVDKSVATTVENTEQWYRIYEDTVDNYSLNLNFAIKTGYTSFTPNLYNFMINATFTSDGNKLINPQVLQVTSGMKVESILKIRIGYKDYRFAVDVLAKIWGKSLNFTVSSNNQKIDVIPVEENDPNFNFLTYNVVEGTAINGVPVATATFNTTREQLKILPEGFDFHNIVSNEINKAGEFYLNGQKFVNGPMTDSNFSYYGRCIIDFTNPARPIIKIWVAVNDIMTFFYASYKYFKKEWTDWKQITTKKDAAYDSLGAIGGSYYPWEEKWGKDLHKVDRFGKWRVGPLSSFTNAPPSKFQNNWKLECRASLVGFATGYRQLIMTNSYNGETWQQCYFVDINKWSPWQKFVFEQPSPAQASYSTFDYGIEGETK